MMYEYAGGASVCDTANCGKGICTEVPLLPPNYECHCDPGWSHALNIFPFSPCIIPNCNPTLLLILSSTRFFGSDCYALGLGTAPPSPAPCGHHGSPEPTTPPSGTNGNGTTTNSLGSALIFFFHVFHLVVAQPPIAAAGHGCDASGRMIMLEHVTKWGRYLGSFL
ncbi:hypothetical protein HU200_022001 [Digitaria exilis]|uniref:EGF-like domain-containing protein n=1 Tax=Digitaria exilis TaxID=1010633 RepID=A0A835C7U5_9POAL|nr:hypothetical protein HU200_022001 [Digitaria exilis]